MLDSVVADPVGRAVAATATAALFMWLVGPAATRLLRRFCREPQKSDSARLDDLHRAKEGTPTMGGLFLVMAIILGALLCGVWQYSGVWLALTVLAGMALVGVVDDLVKLYTRRSGLGWRGKLLGQGAVALVPAISCFAGWYAPADESFLVLPGAHALAGSWLVIPWIVLVIVATANAVNITDGLDGLATGCVICSAMGLAAITACCVWGPERELIVVAGALSGALMGFWPWNRYPARVFMGNTGSLAIGGLLGFLALATGTEMWLPLFGGVFVAEAVSVIVQIVSFKTRGRRVFLCAPLHHHYEFQGWPETKIVRRFCLVAAGCAVLAVGLNMAGATFLSSLADAKSANLAVQRNAEHPELHVSSLPRGGVR
jgi:phospho-N-acetylmuramoyl-pentapeptide-transferase